MPLGRRVAGVSRGARRERKREGNHEDGSRPFNRHAAKLLLSGRNDGGLILVADSQDEPLNEGRRIAGSQQGTKPQKAGSLGP